MFDTRPSTSPAPREPHSMATATPSTPACAHCSSSGTEVVSTMARYTVNAERWFHCVDCGHYFTTSDEM